MVEWLWESVGVKKGSGLGVWQGCSRVVVGCGSGVVGFGRGVAGVR